MEYALDVDHYDEVVSVYGEKDWQRYAMAHPDYLRTYALERAVQGGLTGAEYWKLLSAVYALDECHGVNTRAYLGLYRAEVPPGRRAAMNDDELAVFDALPKVVTLYRAARYEQRYGLSWTLERLVAESIVRKSFAPWTGGNIYTTQVPRSAIMAYYGERSEAEALVDVDVLHHLVEIEEVVKTVTPS